MWKSIYQVSKHLKGFAKAASEKNLERDAAGNNKLINATSTTSRSNTAAGLAWLWQRHVPKFLPHHN